MQLSVLKSRFFLMIQFLIYIYIYIFFVVVVVVAIMTSVDYLEKSLDFQTSDLHPLRNRSIMFSIFK